MTRPNDNCQTFFESIGVDPKTVIFGSPSKDGYYTIVLSEDASRVLYSTGELAREFHPWPNAERDWLRFLDAASKDWLAGNLNSEMHDLIDPML
jgi:hypothetical protein